MEWEHGPCVVVRRLIYIGERVHEPNSLSDNSEIKRIANVDPEATRLHAIFDITKLRPGDPGLSEVYNKAIGQAYQIGLVYKTRGTLSEVLLRDTEEEPDKLAVGISLFAQGGDYRDELRSVGSSHCDPRVEGSATSTVRETIPIMHLRKIVGGFLSVVTYKIESQIAKCEWIFTYLR